jgi:hypothetical protein
MQQPQLAPHLPMHNALVYDGVGVEDLSIDGDIVNLAEIDFEILEKIYRLVNAARVRRLSTMPFSEYLQTQHWHEVRQAELERAGYRCRLCNAAGHDPREPPKRSPTGGLILTVRAELNVHHRTYERRGCELPEDVITLCRECHERHHGINPLAPNRGP